VNDPAAGESAGGEWGAPGPALGLDEVLDGMIDLLDRYEPGADLQVLAFHAAGNATLHRQLLRQHPTVDLSSRLAAGLRSAVAAGDLLALPWRGLQLVPEFLLDGQGRPLSVAVAVTRAARGRSAWAQMIWWTQGQSRLQEMSPVQYLTRHGDSPAVRDALVAVLEPEEPGW
jgi:hypothetical protein